MIDNKKYLFAFLITAVIFGTAVFVSNSISNNRLQEIKDIQAQLSLDILASETQSSLLEETSCKQLNGNVPISKALGEISNRLEAAEEQRGGGDEDLQDLKKQYFLLEIQDYLFMKRVAEKCGIYSTFILYFYSSEEECRDCTKMGYVLTSLREAYPDLRIYSFDYNMDLEALHTLRSIYNLEETLPALVINGDPYYGFRPLNELVDTVPALSRLRAEQSKLQKEATSTKITNPN
jgi:hypothetical protein